MNKKWIVLVIIAFIILPLSAHLYRGNNGRWYSYDTKTGRREELSPTKNISDPRYVESPDIPPNNPYDTTFYSDQTYPRQDGTNRNFGNR